MASPKGEAIFAGICREDPGVVQLLQAVDMTTVLHSTLLTPIGNFRLVCVPEDYCKQLMVPYETAGQARGCENKRRLSCRLVSPTTRT